MRFGGFELSNKDREALSTWVQGGRKLQIMFRV